MIREFRRRFWLPPRAHGDEIEDRTVSFLELFYDLVYVVIIAEAAHTLAAHATWRGVGEFAVIFGMIWVAWLNGSLFHDLHGNEDGRSRSFIFLQMILLAFLAVFTGHAADDSGAGFAIIYAIFLAVIAYQWYSVRRYDTEEYARTTAWWVALVAASAIIVGLTALLAPEWRVIAWAAYLILFLVGGPAALAMLPAELRSGPGDSMIERFGLFTIIVLGEVVVGVVTGLSDVERTWLTLVTGGIGLMIGFGIWWTVFDFVGRRQPRPEVSMTWIYGHLPLTMGIAGSGAALVSLVEHFDDARAPDAAAWILTGSVALVLVSCVIIMRALRDWSRLVAVYRPVASAMIGAAGGLLILGWLRPAPWLLALGVVLILSAVWWTGVSRWLAMENPALIAPDAGD